LTKEIQTINDHFEKTISGYPLATNFVLVLDPEGFLNLDEEYIDIENNKTWRVLSYSGNDLKLRQEYFAQKAEDKALLIWATMSSEQQGRIDLSYIYDIVGKLERTIDLSLQNVLQELIPQVKWPEALFKHSKEIGRNLKTFHGLYDALRKELPHKAPLNENHAKAILIALRNPNVQLSELVLTSMPIQEGIVKYAKIILTNELNEEDRLILTEIIGNNVVGNSGDILPWFKLERDELATLFYLLDVTSRYAIPNPLIQLRGLGLISLDLETLGENNIIKIAKIIESNQDIKSQVKKIAETKLTLQQALRIIQCTRLREPIDIAAAFRSERNPLIAYALAVTFLKEITKKKELKYADLNWTDGLAKQQTIVEETETAFSEKADKLLRLMANITAILHTLETPFETKNDLATLIDWWSDSGFYKTQLVITDAANYCQSKCEDDDLRKVLDSFIQSLKQRLRDKIEQADQNMALIIGKNWKGYLAHPRLSTNILREYIIKRSLKPSEDRKIWILIFDGMRLDTWKQVVKPILQTKFEIKEEKLYVSTLPSETDIARVAVLAGGPPNEWEDYNGGFTYDHNILSSRLFGLSRYKGMDKLRVTVNAEADFGRQRLDTGTFLYNILIYNLSDKWIHTFPGDLHELNKNIEGTMDRIIVPDLERRIGEKDFIVLTSDHGFIELAKEDELKVFTTGSGTFTTDTTKQEIAYRVLENIENPKGYRISYFPLKFFTVAVGRKWFSRPQGKFSRYTHGGISLDEMVVPGVIMEKIVFPRLELNLTCLDSIELTEDAHSNFEVKITNDGNRATDYQLSFRLNTGEVEEHLRSIQPNESQTFSFEFQKPTLAMRNLEITLFYRTPSKEPLKPEKRVIPVKVKERKDKVEFKFGGLDKIME
jgi:hypothetical protein